MNKHFIPSRRDVLKGGGALVVSFSLAGQLDAALAQGARRGKPLALTEVDSFLAIDAKGMVTVYSGKVDLGTGVRHRAPQIVAEELDVPMARDQSDRRRHRGSRPTRARPGAASRSRSAACSSARRRRPRAWR